MAQQIDANLNNTECLTTKVHFGYDTFINLCSGVERTVDWTFADWGALGFFIFLGIALVGVVVMFGFMLADMFRNGF